MTTPAQREAWFDAVDRFDTQRMLDLMADGVSINTLNARGQTALFSVVAPWGGRPEAVEWLVERGIDVNVRDAAGQSAVQLGHAHVSSALEANMARHIEHVCREAGYVDDVIELRQLRSQARPKRRSRRAGPQASDFFGRWRVADGEDAGAELEITARSITSTLRWLELRVSGHGLSPGGQMRLDGEHHAELVHVSLAQVGGGRVRLVWNDGVTYAAEVLLERPPE